MKVALALILWLLLLAACDNCSCRANPERPCSGFTFAAGRCGEDIEARVPRSRRSTNTLEKAIDGHPSLLLFVDYTCRTICGPALAIASGAVSQSGLDPASDYRLIVVGLDPKDTLDDMRRMGQQIGDPRIDRATVLLRGDPETDPSTNRGAWLSLSL